MKNLFSAMMFLLALGLVLPAVSLAQGMGGSESGAPSESQYGAPSEQQDRPAADASAQAQPILGTVAAVDSSASAITVQDKASGITTTFSVQDKSQLNGIQPGDEVNITPRQDNPSQAESVQKL